jgi:hypothetical protein
MYTKQRLWCNQCKKEFTPDEADEKEVDTMWGDGRWWHCRSCGKELTLYPDIGDEEQKIISQACVALEAMKNPSTLLKIDEICLLLIEIQKSYSENLNGVGACEVLFNLKEIAPKNDLPYLVSFSDAAFREVAKKTMGLPEQEIMSVSNLLKRYIAYFFPE